MKKIILLLLLTTAILFGGAKFHDLRLLHYPQARPWLQDADTNGASANNIGILYYKTIKDNKKAIEWLEKAYKLGSIDAAYNMGYIYEDLKQYKKAIFWYKEAIKGKDKIAALNLGLLYKKAYKMGNIGAATNLGYLYNVILHNNKKGITWYRKAAKCGDLNGIKNLALSNRDNRKKIEGAAWYIALIDLKYPKQKVLTYLKTKWKLTDKEIKKAYQLQKTLDIPKHYYDPAFETKIPEPHRNRRGIGR